MYLRTCTNETHSLASLQYFWLHDMLLINLPAKVGIKSCSDSRECLPAAIVYLSIHMQLDGE